MKILKTMVAICAVLLIASSALAQPDTATQQKLAEVKSKVEKIKSYRVTMKMETEMMGQTMTTDGRMTFKKPGKMRMTTKMDMVPGGGTQEMYSNGDITWTYMPAMHMATKMDMKKLRAAGQDQPGMVRNGDVSKPFEGFPEDKIKYIERKDTDEGSVYVFEVETGYGAQMPAGSQQGQMLPNKMILWLSPDTGLPVKTIMIGKNGATMMEQTYTDYQINPEIDDSVFEFTPPEGVQVMDMTEGAMNMMQQMQGSQSKQGNQSK